MKKIPVGTGVLAVALSMALAFAPGCSGSGETVSVQSVAIICGVGSTVKVERFAGVVEAKQETEIQKDSGFSVDEIFVDVGDAVTEGQVLFVYDKEKSSLELEKAELELELQKTTVEEKKTSITQLERERDRVGESAKLGYTLQIQQLEVEITETEFAIQAKEKELEVQRAALEQLEVRAPVSGSVRSINTSGATDDYGNPLPFMVLTETGDYRVKGYVNEVNRASLYEGMDVVVRSRVDGTVQKGTISLIDLANPSSGNGNMYYYDAGDDTTNSSKYPFYVKLDASDGFILGQHVYIEPDYGQTDGQSTEGVFLPDYYIVDADGNPYVWAESARGKLEKRRVTLGQYDEAMGVYMIEGGLTFEDYVAFPEEGLRSGMACTEYDGYADVPYEGSFDFDEGEYTGEFVPDYDPAVYDGLEGPVMEDGSVMVEDGVFAIGSTSNEAEAA